ncbi:MAG: hypothetical protein IIT36_05120 [Aeriscardovia sp.]|uniref:Uncharacterized protein n=2 Tax=Gammaproteobacteria TaxID=1236 RepID=A0A368TMW0_9GAMM|nr:hypothetical protein [Aeriscardovia sp.]RCV85860.1 hypothetical protein DU506_19880 [Halomonas rituensis]
MCDTINNEIGRLTASLNYRHVGSTTAVAVLIYVTTCMFTHYGEDHGVDRTPLLSVQQRAVGDFLVGQGVGSSEGDEALVDLARANGTVAYLASLPG